MRCGSADTPKRSLMSRATSVCSSSARCFSRSMVLRFQTLDTAKGSAVEREDGHHARAALATWRPRYCSALRDAGDERKRVLVFCLSAVFFPAATHRHTARRSTHAGRAAAAATAAGAQCGAQPAVRAPRPPRDRDGQGSPKRRRHPSRARQGGRALHSAYHLFTVVSRRLAAAPCAPPFLRVREAEGKEFSPLVLLPPCSTK